MRRSIIFAFIIFSLGCTESITGKIEIRNYSFCSRFHSEYISQGIFIINKSKNQKKIIFYQVITTNKNNNQIEEATYNITLNPGQEFPIACTEDSYYKKEIKISKEMNVDN